MLVRVVSWIVCPPQNPGVEGNLPLGSCLNPYLTRLISFDSFDFEVGDWMDFPGGGAPVTGLAGCGVLRFVSVIRVVEEPTLE